MDVRPNIQIIWKQGTLKASRYIQQNHVHPAEHFTESLFQTSRIEWRALFSFTNEKPNCNPVPWLTWHLWQKWHGQACDGCYYFIQNSLHKQHNTQQLGYVMPCVSACLSFSDHGFTLTSLWDCRISLYQVQCDCPFKIQCNIAKYHELWRGNRPEECAQILTNFLNVHKAFKPL